jgi:hypothetical protein
VGCLEGPGVLGWVSFPELLSGFLVEVPEVKTLLESKERNVPRLVSVAKATELTTFEEEVVTYKTRTTGYFQVWNAQKILGTKLSETETTAIENAVSGQK